MLLNITVITSKWARLYRALFAVVLGFTVLFSSTQVFAAVHSTHQHVSQLNAAPASHMDEMQASQHSAHSHSDNCKGIDCTCMGHCSSVWLSQQILGIHHGWHKSTVSILAEITPASHINTPPQRPPRA